MNRKLILVIIVTLFVTAVASYVNSKNYKVGNLTGSGFIRNNPNIFPTSLTTPESPQAPKSFKFNSSTDLKMELEKVNPQVLDSDFEVSKSL